MKKILFQGDSITDAMRSYEFDYMRGSGYATLVSAALGLERPNEFEFINRGISGDRSIDLLARIKCDLINLAPDYLSILIGINDVWHDIDMSNGVSPENFELYYNIILNQVKEALPDCKIMIMEPFVLKGSATAENWDKFSSGTYTMAQKVKKISVEHNVKFIPLMDKFNEAAKLAPSDYWLLDGVHPTAMGHEIIKNEWIKAFKEL